MSDVHDSPWPVECRFYTVSRIDPDRLYACFLVALAVFVGILLIEALR
jgi:hypothetical protein